MISSDKDIVHTRMKVLEVVSEIPCRVSSDPHEWCNDLGAVSTRDSAKLQWR